MVRAIIMSHVCGIAHADGGTRATPCVWYSSRRRWDSGHAGPRSLTTRPTTTRPYIMNVCVIKALSIANADER